jgi:hypothetical protein
LKFNRWASVRIRTSFSCQPPISASRRSIRGRRDGQGNCTSHDFRSDTERSKKDAQIAREALSAGLARIRPGRPHVISNLTGPALETERPFDGEVPEFRIAALALQLWRVIMIGRLVGMGHECAGL